MPVNRRFFISSALGAIGASQIVHAAETTFQPSDSKAGELKTDILIIGGGLGGCSAALAALKAGMKVILTEPTDWIGGQSTSQAVPYDEHPWIEKVSNKSYAELRRRIRQHYRDNYPLTEAARNDPNLNPGAGGVSRICCEPKASLAALTSMLAPYETFDHLTVLLLHEPIAADCHDDKVLSVEFLNKADNGKSVIRADYILDASELGDLLPLAGIEFVTGAESRGDTGELHAPEQALPEDHQAFTICFALDHCPGEEHLIEKPADYAFWRDYVPALTPAWPGRLLSLDSTHPVTLEKRTQEFDPVLEGKNEVRGLWRYRRICFAGHYPTESGARDITLVNWPMTDYWLGNLHGAPIGLNTESIARAKQLSLSMVYWLQTEAPRQDGGSGWKGLRLRGDLMGSSDGLAKFPYVRESRRIKPLTRVLEQHVGREGRENETGITGKELTAAPFEDTVGIGYYRIDLHPSSGQRNYIDIDSLPFQIPLGALIPVRAKNVLACCKNIGTTHLTNGCYRLHPVEWNIGEAAGLLAAVCLKKGWSPHQVHQDKGLLNEFQSLLANEGIPLKWEKEIIAG